MFDKIKVASWWTFLLLTLPFAAAHADRIFQHENGVLKLEETPQRIVALNWAATEALLLLGVTPVGVADLEGYRHWVTQPYLPERGVRNVGTRVAPSLEAIAELEPDLIITSREMAPASGLLDTIAPTYVISVFSEHSEPYAKAREMLETLGEMLDRKTRAQEIMSGIETTLSEKRREIEKAGLSGRSVNLVSFIDNRHVRVYTEQSLLTEALNAMGLQNAWHKTGNFWGFSVVGLESIAPMDSSLLAVLSPSPPGLHDSLSVSPFWQHLPQVEKSNVYEAGTVWPFGGVYQVARLAEQLAQGLLAGGESNVR